MSASVSFSRSLRALVSGSILFLSALASADSISANPLKFRVTVQNVTAANAISPYLVVVLKPGARLFETGKPASPGIAAIAERGDTSVLEGELAAEPAVLATAKVAGGPLGAAESRSVEFAVNSKTAAGATFNLVAMIGKSNDSFVSVHGLSLARIWQAGKFRLNASNYDAGSEENSGNVGDFGAGGHPIAQAEGHISVDRGLNAKGDAPEILGWGPVAASVLVERVQ